MDGEQWRTYSLSTLAEGFADGRHKPAGESVCSSRGSLLGLPVSLPPHTESTNFWVKYLQIPQQKITQALPNPSPPGRLTEPIFAALSANSYPFQEHPLGITNLKAS